jgi:hypothetical protein
LGGNFPSLDTRPADAGRRELRRRPVEFKKCCAAKGETTTAGLLAAVRMKGGVSFDPAATAYRAIVHSWDNAECIGEPQEWRSVETFASEDAAMTFYKANIRAGLERLVAEASRKVKDGTFMHRRLE